MGDHEDSKLIGIYSTEADANDARARAAKLSGFREHPQDFIIDRYVVDEDNWVEGFGTANE
jgi:hypothetical protein